VSGDGEPATGTPRGVPVASGPARSARGGSTPAGSGPARALTRRRLLTLGLPAAAVAAGGVTAGLELVSRGFLPGQQVLDRLDGACSVASPPMTFARPGRMITGRFFSPARRREVGYAIAWPPGHGPGSPLPLVVALHGFGSSHGHALTGMTLAQAAALKTGGQPLPPVAIAAADGGGGYWHPHPGDDPMGMIVNEFIPLCQRLGLGRPPQRIAALGISMGGYGALLLAEKYPGLISAAAAISPAVWTGYPQARAANPGAYASAADFAANDVVTHATALAQVAVRVAGGIDDPFHPGVAALARALPPEAVVDISHGCHSAPFFLAQEPPSLAFLARHLTAGGGRTGAAAA